MVELTRKYLSARLDEKTTFGYGLLRRSEMLASAVSRFANAEPGAVLDVVDFGCADGAMLEFLSRCLGDRMRRGVGVDVFRAGVPAAVGVDGNIRFVAVDLFKTYPYPLSESSCDVAVVSAFLKHHPEPERFLLEVARILRPGGIVVVLDPRPWVVRVGMLFGRFNPRYNPSLWDAKFLEELLEKLPDSSLRIEHFERYWVAPNHSIYHLGFEKSLPRPIARWLALHQCMVLRRN